MTIQEVYEKYEHLDSLLSDKDWFGDGIRDRILLDLWQTIKEEIDIKGLWPQNDLRRAFVDGAKWWEFKKTGFTMWQSDQTSAEKEADRRYKKEMEENNDT